MDRRKSGGIKQLALMAGLAMALGPLTALTVAAINEGSAGLPVITAQPEPRPTYDTTRISSSDYSGKMLADVAASSGSLDFFSSVLNAAEVDDMLRGDRQFTVFIPVNEAFSRIGGEQLSTILNDPARVQSLARAHVVPGRITATDLMSGTRVEALNGQEIASRSGAEITVNGASIIGSEVAENGIVHYVDRLL